MTRYGKGVYFARDASYSDPFIDSKWGKKKMFVVQLCVGEVCLGKKDQLVPDGRWLCQ